MGKMRLVGLSLVFGLLCACTQKEASDIFSKVEGYMELYPDSALWLLNQIPHPEELRGKQRADYALLLTQARDKNYLDSLQSDSLIKFAVNYYEGGDDRVKAGKALFYYGRIQVLHQNDCVAMHSYLKAQKVFEETKEYQMQAIVYQNIGSLNNAKKMYDIALDNYSKSIFYYQQANDTLGIAYIYRDIARIYSIRCNYKNVYEYINRGLSMLKKYSNAFESNRLIASYYHILGVTKRDEGDYSSAIDYLLKANSMEENAVSVCHNSLSLGDVYLRMGKLEDAGRCFERALLSKHIYTKAGGYHLLYLLEKKWGNYKDALAYKEKSDSLSQVLNSDEANSQLLNLQRKYEKNILIVENQQLRQAKRSQLYLGLAVVLLIMLLSTVLYIILKKKLEKRFLNTVRVVVENETLIKKYMYELETLKRKEGEIAEKNKKEIGKLNQKILLLQNENREMRENVCVNGAYFLDRLKHRKITVKSMTKQEQKKVLEYIDLIYGDFISRLRKEYILTDGDLMLAGLLKSGFTSADLIYTFACEPNSFFKKRQRLRNSLNLGKDKKVEEFIALY